MCSDPSELRASILIGQYGFLMPWEAFLLSGIREKFPTKRKKARLAAGL